MYCSKCGLELPDDAEFCIFCGEPTDRLTSPQIQPTQPTPAPAPTPTPYQGTSGTTTRSSSSSGGIIAALCIVLMIGILLIFFGTQITYFNPSTGITILVVGAIVILCIGCRACGTGRRRRGYGGGNCSGGGGGSDCSGCDCGDCDCGGCDC